MAGPAAHDVCARGHGDVAGKTRNRRDVFGERLWYTWVRIRVARRSRWGLTMPVQTDQTAQANGHLHTLDRELQTFRANLASLLVDHEGKFVLIHGDQVAGVFDTWQQGIAEGYRRFDLEPFLVKRIAAAEKPIFLSREPL